MARQFTILLLGFVMLTSKILYPDDKEAHIFIKNYNRLNKKIAIGTSDLGDYLRVFYLDQIMVAGYCINTAYPFHYFKPVPEETWQKLSKKDDFVETFHVWIDNNSGQVRQMHKSWIYILCLIDAFKTGKKYIVGGSLVPKVRDQQMLVLSKPLHTGTLVIEEKIFDVWIYYNSRIMAMASLPVGLVKNTLRALVKKIETAQLKVLD